MSSPYTKAEAEELRRNGISVNSVPTAARVAPVKPSSESVLVKTVHLLLAELAKVKKPVKYRFKFSHNADGSTREIIAEPME